MLSGDAHVAEDNEDLQEGVGSAQSFDECLRQQVADPFGQHDAVQVGNEKAKITVDRNGLVIRKASIDGTIQV